MPIRKLEEQKPLNTRQDCTDPDHDLPQRIQACSRLVTIKVGLVPNKYEHVCPSCLTRTVFEITEWGTLA